MKKTVLSTLGMLAIATLIIVSCKKDDVINEKSKNSSEVLSHLDKSVIKFQPEFLINKNNPFDSYGLKMSSFYYNYSELLQNKENSDFNIYQTNFNELVKKHLNDLYPEVQKDEYSEYESSIISEFNDVVNIKILKSISEKFENRVIADSKLSYIQKNRLLSIISQFKFTYYYNYVIYAQTWEQRFDSCMRRELGAVFKDDGNPVPEAGFILGLPGSLLWMEAGCAWEATFD